MSAIPAPWRPHVLKGLLNMLAKSCLTEFGAMPPLDQSTFEDWSGPRDSISPKPICEKRLHFGDLDLPREELTGKVYAYLCSGSSNRVAFTVGPNNLTLKPTEMRLVAPTESFLSLYKVPGDFKTTDYVKKAKAYTCLLFLAAGHVRTVEGYVDFSRDLKDACWTIGKAQIESEGSISVDSDIESEVKISKSPEAHVKRERDATDADEDCDRSKRARFGKAMSRIQTRHRELDEEIATFTKEYITFSQSSPDAADSEAVISRNAAEINELKTLIESEKSNNAEYWTTIQHYKSREDQENNAVETLKLELQGKSEALNRIKGEKEEVEKKLRDFVEAQKKIMAMCGGGTV